MLFFIFLFLEVQVKAKEIGSGARIKIVVDAGVAGADVRASRDLGIETLVFGDDECVLYPGGEAEVGMRHMIDLPEIIAADGIITAQEAGILPIHVAHPNLWVAAFEVG